jgi:hypothetical protein
MYSPGEHTSQSPQTSGSLRSVPVHPPMRAWPVAVHGWHSMHSVAGSNGSVGEPRVVPLHRSTAEEMYEPSGHDAVHFWHDWVEYSVFPGHMLPEMVSMGLQPGHLMQSVPRTPLGPSVLDASHLSGLM